jgi:hypothetical protein
LRTCNLRKNARKVERISQHAIEEQFWSGSGPLGSVVSK